MVRQIRRVLLGRERPASIRHPVLLLAPALLLATTAAYATGLFSISGGVVWIPSQAALVGALAGSWIGYSRRGLLSAWLLAYASLLGYLADHAAFGLSGRPPIERAAYFFSLDGLAFLAIEAVALGTIAFAVGAAARCVTGAIRDGTAE
jgi:hypothetical protein